MKTIILIIAIALLSGCYSNKDAIAALTTSGYTDIELHGYAAFSCAKDDTFAIKFTAKSPSGEAATGAVCSGWLKGKTIRLD